jgi:eukaryotic-like serine/threonine-protein kinase
MQMKDRVGQQFGNYRLKRLIGKGGYAEVYLAEHILLPDLHYAIKVLTGTNLEDYKEDRKKEEFLFEARAITNLQRLSSHIVQIRDFGIQTSEVAGKEREIPYIVMEYASEGTLRQLYPHGKMMPLERIAFYVNQIAEALQCAHDQKPPIVHRDVKPENMLLRTIDHALLSDFGIAMTAKTDLITRPIKHETGVVGTATYIAPERLSGNMRRASDQYSLGIVVYEWLCGSPPFNGTETEICVKHLKMPPPPLSPTYPHVTTEIEQVVMRSLEKMPEERYPSVKAFADALESAIETAQKPQLQQLRSVTIPQGISALPPVVPKKAAKKQTVDWPVLPTKQHISGTTQPFTLTPPPLADASVAQPTRSLGKRLQDFFELSEQFARDSKYSFFRNFGILLNALSAVIAGLLLHNIYVFLGCLLFSSLAFWLCVRAVEEKLAQFFGILIALYWSWIGWISGTYVVSLLPYNNLLLPLFTSLAFLSVSLGAHIRYVSRKNL